MANERACFHSRRRIQHTAYFFLFLESCSPHLLYPPNAAGELSIDIHGARSLPLNDKRKIRHSSRCISRRPYLSADNMRSKRGFLAVVSRLWSVGRALRSLFTLSSVCTHPERVISRDQKYTMRRRKFAPAASHLLDGRGFAVRLR